jgi:hypothetical protein
MIDRTSGVISRISSTFSWSLWDQMRKLCCAAALALTGWYLMLPPITLEPSPHIDAEAPLSQWFIESNYGSTGACEVGRAALLVRMQNARCVAAKDPRLTR